MTISTRIRQLRHERGLTQEQLGQLCGASKSAVSQWEAGTTLPSLSNIMAMRESLGFSLDWLLTGAAPLCGGNAKTQRLADLFNDLDERGQSAVFRVAEAESAYIVKPSGLPKRSA